MLGGGRDSVFGVLELRVVVLGGPGGGGGFSVWGFGTEGFGVFFGGVGVQCLGFSGMELSAPPKCGD